MIIMGMIPIHIHTIHTHTLTYSYPYPYMSISIPIHIHTHTYPCHTHVGWSTQHTGLTSINGHLYARRCGHYPGPMLACCQLPARCAHNTRGLCAPPQPTCMICDPHSLSRNCHIEQLYQPLPTRKALCSTGGQEVPCAMPTSKSTVRNDHADQ
jgi:hypothetical protein